MTYKPQNEKDKSEVNANTAEKEKILCPHCKRTATNGIKCKGICVADNDY
ncbi:MAG: hypothetical protein IGS23_11975 [Rivularia sp. T60_A2020_040]|nr:hypothetical protein [Rivularia sp. T60_A2020_040]